MIRPVEEKDLPACGSVYTKAFPAEYWGIDWNADTAAAYLRDFFEQKKFVGYVFEENGEIAGCLFALRRISGSKEELYINEMAVLPEKQGRGIGTALLNSARQYCLENGLAGAVLYTNENTPAARFWQKNGFELSRGTVCMYCQEKE